MHDDVQFDAIEGRSVPGAGRRSSGGADGWPPRRFVPANRAFAACGLLSSLGSVHRRPATARGDQRDRCDCSRSLGGRKRSHRVHRRHGRLWPPAAEADGARGRRHRRLARAGHPGGPCRAGALLARGSRHRGAPREHDRAARPLSVSEREEAPDVPSTVILSEAKDLT
jgi:hypothetical protein